MACVQREWGGRWMEAEDRKTLLYLLKVSPATGFNCLRRQRLMIPSKIIIKKRERVCLLVIHSIIHTARRELTHTLHPQYTASIITQNTPWTPGTNTSLRQQTRKHTHTHTEHAKSFDTYRLLSVMNLNSKHWHARALTNTLEIKLYPKTTSWGSLVISPNPTNLLLWPLPLKGRLISPLMQQQWNVPWNAVIGVLSLNGIRSQYACSRFVKTTSQQRLEASSFLFKSNILNVNTKITSDYQSVCVHFCHFDSAV